jgi:HSP20 family molecular chaperone IbpA
LTSEQPGKPQSVLVVESDILDTMTETMELIAQRAYEIYQSRGGQHGSDQDDWFRAEGEVLPDLPTHFHVTESEVQLTVQVHGFDAKDLEVEVGHRRAVLVGVHPASHPAAGKSSKEKRVMRIVELPFDVDPAAASATLQSGTLQVVLPRA